MKNNSTVKYRYLVVTLLLFAGFTGIASADERYTLHISNPTIAKVPIAVPLLMTVSGSSEEAAVSAEISKLITEFLVFTGSFNVTGRDAYLDEPARTGIDKNRINYKNWVDIGTEFLVTGAVHIENKYIYLEFHLYDTIRARELVAKKYKARSTNLKLVASKFTSHIVSLVTGNAGFFESKIAFVSSGTGNKEIYICDFDGSNPVKVTNEKAITLSPAWSPDNKKLAYTSYRRGKPDIYVKNLVTQSVVSIVSEAGSNITPV
jgi:TolB protein